MKNDEREDLHRVFDTLRAYDREKLPSFERVMDLDKRPTQLRVQWVSVLAAGSAITASLIIIALALLTGRADLPLAKATPEVGAVAMETMTNWSAASDTMFEQDGLIWLGQVAMATDALLEVQPSATR